ncbi:MAG: hypothetical protein SGJ23_08030 [Alphaproteobacteria bacterium]|nr:hypothetical protein [Alphaproteobacteria bacterium]
MNQDRRNILNAAAGAMLAGAVAPAVAQEPAAPSKAGEFDFLNGEWRIAHRRLKAPGEWDVFDGEATCWSILGGVASVEELRIPARNFAGMGLRTLDQTNHVWMDYWMNAKVGLVGGAGTPGRFINGDGVFTSDDTADGKPIKVRGLWDRITGRSHRWSQSVSRDGGVTWEDNWLMEWVKV